MAAFDLSERMILKILSGAQAGVEVHLDPSEYSIGSGDEDDIHVVDVSMKPNHMRVRVSPGKIEIKGEAGAFLSAGRSHSSGDGWLEIQPLEIVAAGATRLAFGGPTALWSSIADHDAATASEPTPEPAPTDRFHRLLAWASDLRYLFGPAALLVVLTVTGFVFFNVKDKGGVLASGANRNQLAAVRKALDSFPFGQAISVNEDVDGSIYVVGYVETPVERRAIAGAIDAAGIPVHLRLGVRQILRSELDGLIKAEKVAVKYDLSSTGVLTLDGVILDRAAADRFVGEIAQNAPGLNKVVSQIKTAQDLLADIKGLAHLSQIDDKVVFQLENLVVQANGVVSPNKIDAWIGFLQAYSQRFGDQIGLRSFVQLQQDPAAPTPLAQGLPQMPLMLGALPEGMEPNIDIARVKSGDFDAKEAFAGPSRPALAPQQSESVRAASDLSAAADQKSFAVGPGGAPSLSSAPSDAVIPNAGAMPRDPPAENRTAAPRDPPAENRSVAPSDPPTENSSAAPHDPSPVASPSLPASAPILAPSQQRDVTPQPTAASAGADIQTKAPAKSTADRVAATSSQPASAPSTASDRQISSSSAQTSLSPLDFAATRLAPSTPADASRLANADDLSRRADDLMNRWLDGRLAPVAPNKSKSGALARALDALAVQTADPGETALKELDEKSKETFAHKYLPLFGLSMAAEAKSSGTCRPNSHLTADDLPAVLFWLDLLSATDAMKISDFAPKDEAKILEAALNPKLAAHCLGRDAARARIADDSIYLQEAGKNRDFVRFVTLGLPTYALDVTGAAMWTSRFVALRDGTLLHEGEAPNADSRIDTIGELGVVVRLATGFAAVVYPADMPWIGERGFAVNASRRDQKTPEGAR